MKKRLLSWFLSAVMVLTMLPVTVLAEGPEETDVPAEGAEIADTLPQEAPAEPSADAGAAEEPAPAEPSAGEEESLPAVDVTEREIPVGDPQEFGYNGLSWELADGVLTISGEGYMGDFNENGTNLPWLDSKDQITKVVIGEGVTSVGAYAFAGCENLEEITLPEIDSYDGLFIGDHAFAGCTKLARVEFPACCTINQYAFSGCSGLEEIVLPEKGNTNGITIGYYAFENCTKLTRVALPRGCSTRGYSFVGCENLEEVTFAEGGNSYDNFYLEEYTFSGCTKLTKLEIPSSCTVNYNAFAGCTGLKELRISRNSYVYDQAFAGCTGLETIYLLGYVNVYDEAFSGVTATVYCPASYAYNYQDYNDEFYQYGGTLTWVQANLEVTVVGTSYPGVAPNGSLTMQVNVTAAVDPAAVAFRWTQSQSYYGDETTIVGADKASYTVEQVTGRAYYHCYVTDDYGNERSFTWSVSIDNQLTVQREGKQDVAVPLNGDVTLKANVTGIDLTKVTYRWEKQYYDAEDNYHNDTIEGADQATYTVVGVNAPVTYRCYVEDGYGGNETTSWNVFVDNNLTLARQGEENVYVHPHADAVLQVSFNATDKDGLQVKWSYNESLTVEESDDHTTLTVKDVTGYSYASCTVTDKYNNTKSVDFYVQVDNEFSASIVGNQNVYAQPNGSLELQVDVSVVDTTGLTCTWSGGSGNMTVTPSETQPATACTVSDVVGTGTVRCYVSDGYGNGRTLYFYVYVDNGFTVAATSPKSLYVDPEEDAVLSVKFSANDKSQLQATWSVTSGDESLVLTPVTDLEAGTSTVTLKKVDRKMSLRFSLLDQYGNAGSADFNVVVDNDLEILGNSYSTVNAAPGDSPELKVNIAAIDTTGVTYEWSKSYYGSNLTLVPNESDRSQCTVQNVTASGTAICRVTDRFGNSLTAEFYVSVDTGSEPPEPSQDIEIWPVDNSDFYVDNPGDSVTMKVNVTPPEGVEVELQWYKENDNYEDEPIPGATTDTLTVQVDNSAEYTCRANKKGQPNNTWGTVFYVHVNNKLSVTCEDGNTRNVAPNSNTTLKVKVSANDTEGLKYEWRRGGTSLAETTDTLQVSNVKSYSQYQCRVTDKFGNQASAWFYVGVDNGLTAEAVGETTVYVTNPGSSVDLQVNFDATDKSALVKSWSGSDRFAIVPGDDMTTCTVSGIKSSGTVTFTVQDQYGNSKSVSFSIRIKNKITVTPEGESDIFVKPDGSATLKVKVTADLTNNLKYRWYMNTRGNTVYLTNVTDTLTVEHINSYATYTCTVSDRYGNSGQTGFMVSVDNGFSTKIDGDSERYVPAGSDVTLKINVQAVDFEGMKYEWNMYSPSGINEDLSDVNSATLTVKNVQKYAEYSCVVTDKYGNSDHSWFVVGVDNGFSVKPKGGSDQVLVNKGDDVTLQLQVSAKDKTGMTCKWYSAHRNKNGGWTTDDLIGGVTGDSYSIQNVQTAAAFMCHVTDRFGNEARQWLYVNVNNGLTVTREGEYERFVTLNETTTMQVHATAAETDGMTYQWKISKWNTEEDYWQTTTINGATGDSYTTEPVTRGSVKYYCTVTDKYGNYKQISFAVGVENGFSVTALSDSHRFVAPGSTAEMAVQATAATGELTYKWTEYPGGNTVGSSDQATLTSKSVNDYLEYSCQVVDQYYNTKTLWFELEPKESVVASGSYDNGINWQIQDVDDALVLIVDGEGTVPAAQPEGWAQYKATVCAVKLGADITGVAANAFTGLTAVKDLYVSAYQTGSWATFTAASAGLAATTELHFWKNMAVTVQTSVDATEAAPVTFRLTDSEGNVVSNSKDENKTQSLENVADGTYTMTVAQEGCVARTVNVEVKKGDTAIPTVTLVQVGNLNGKSGAQGETDATDMQCLFTYLAEDTMTGELAGDQTYFQAVSDVNSDGVTDILDYQALYEIVTPAS